jgi:hypothetical protein
MKSARIAQMESSRFVSGSAESQDLLRAPNLSSRMDATGISHPSGPRGATRYYADSIPFPPDPYELSGRALLKRGYVAQALIDSAAVCFCFLFLVSVALSIPLALFLLLFASF